MTLPVGTGSPLGPLTVRVSWGCSSGVLGTERFSVGVVVPEDVTMRVGVWVANEVLYKLSPL
jgi:hypothetical protein